MVAMIHKTKGFVYHHVPKTGGTSIGNWVANNIGNDVYWIGTRGVRTLTRDATTEMFLGWNDEEDYYEWMDWWRKHGTGVNHFPPHIQVSRVKKLLRTNRRTKHLETKHFAFLRNPWDWITSLFWHRKNLRSPMDKIYAKHILGQKNEVSLLKLLFLSQDKANEAKTDHIIFRSGISAFELEDLLLNRDFKKALNTINYMKEHDRQNSAPIIWIIAKVINSCLESLKSANKKSALINSGVWSSKINLYLNLIKQATANEFLSLNEEILKVDLINKGLLRAETWEQIERVILKLQDATSLQN